ncbi:hypothetical protein MTO96_042168 [Rhipicephalus appendiculatus]
MLLALISTSRSSEFDVIFPEKGCPELKQQRSRGQIHPLSAPQLKGIGESCKNTAECQPELRRVLREWSLSQRRRLLHKWNVRRIEVRPFRIKAYLLKTAMVSTTG